MDSLIRFHKSDENSSNEMSNVMDAAKALTKRGASVVLLHHKGKSEASYRGSSEILAGCDIMYSLSYDNEEKMLRLKAVKHRYLPEFSICMKLLEDEEGHLKFKISDDPGYLEYQQNMDLIDEIIMKFNEEGVEPNQTIISKEANEHDPSLNRSKVLKLLKKGVGKRWVETGGHQRNEKRYKSLNLVVQLSSPIGTDNWTTKSKEYLEEVKNL